MKTPLTKLKSNLAAYRKTVDTIFSEPPSNSDDLREYFREVLIAVSRLYLDYLFLTKKSSTFETVSSRMSRRGLPKTDIHREQAFRQRFRDRLETCTLWVDFIPENPFSEDTGLHTLQDYINRFTLHLPEIYEETFRVEECTKRFLVTPEDVLLTEMLLGMEHMGRNHINFVQQALEWVTAEISWSEPS
jgi:hypothetical protein